MNKKLLQLLTDKCKDMGLTEKAIQDLATAGSDGLKEDTPDTDIEARANQLFNYAKITQGESTRWAQKTKDQQQTEIEKLTKELADLKGGQGGKEPPKNKDVPDEMEGKMEKYFEAFFEKKYGQSIDDFQKEHTSLKQEKLASERKEAIQGYVEKLKIPNVHAKRLHFPDSMSLDEVMKELTDYKQELITEKLMPEDDADIALTQKAATKEQGEALFDRYAIKD